MINEIMNNYEFDVNDMISTANTLIERTKVFGDVEPGDKIGFKDDLSLYVCKNSYTQSLERWLYSQDRVSNFHNLNKLFTDYNTFLRMLIFYIDKKSSNMIDSMREIIYSIFVNNKIIIHGCEHLLITYTSDKYQSWINKFHPNKNSNEYVCIEKLLKEQIYNINSKNHHLLKHFVSSNSL